MVIFFLKNKSVFRNEENQLANGAGQDGLTYNNEILGDLVNRDTDADTVPDWEEALWGTDPTKKDTDDDGKSDSAEIEGLKAEQELSAEGELSLDASSSSTEDENLTETDKFSREFFTTIASLQESGSIDDATVDQLSTSLAEHIKNSPPRKVFSLADIKTIKNDTVEAVKTYDASLDNIYTKYPVKENVMDILQRFIVDENNVDASVLLELDPITENTNKIIGELIKVNVPQSFSSLHVDFLNGLQRVSENLSDMQLYEDDTIVALSAISQYDKNTETLQTAITSLGNKINQKLKI